MSIISVSRNCKGLWIPIHIWTYENLTTNEKVLLSEIHSLCSKGECFATNEYFSKFLGIHKTNISKMISNLKKLGFVNVNIVYKENSKEIDKRIIKINTVKYNLDLKEIDKEELEFALREMEQSQGTTAPIPPTQKHQDPLDVNTKDINKFINNNINNYIISSSSSSENQPTEKNKTKIFGFEEEKEKSQNNTEKNIKENEILHNTIKVAKSKKGKKTERIDKELTTEQYQYILEYFERVIENKVDITLKIKKDISDILALGYNVEQIKSTIDYLISYLQDKDEPEKLTTRYFLNPAYFEHNFQKFQADTMVHKRKMNSRSYDLDRYESNYDFFDEIKNHKFNNNLFDDETEDDDLDLL